MNGDEQKMLIDFHTHVFPDKIAGRTLEILENNIIKIQHREYPPVSDGTLSGRVESMEKYDVTASVVMPIATTVKQSASINKFAAKINNTEINGRKIYSFGSLHPMQENWEETLEEIAGLGLRGIKLHPEYQETFIDSPESVRLLKKAEELGLKVMIHAGADIGMPPPVHCSPQALAGLLDKIGGDNIIAAHMGGWRLWEDVYKYLKGSPIMFDACYVGGFIDPDLFVKLVEEHGSDKILFGTDMPWQSAGATREFIDGFGFDNETLDNIYYKNALRLLGE